MRIIHPHFPAFGALSRGLGALIAGAGVVSACQALGSTAAANPVPAKTWLADNGNGTFTNPIFYDEFSDPDLIRVGDDFYMTGTTMHAMPGLPILHSRDLVNWEFLTYALDKLDLGPSYRLEDGGNIYGKGIWAPCLRYHDGTWYIFSNVNHSTTQMFTAKSPRGPWTRTPMKRSFHDLSVLFDDDGKVYVVWNYQEVHLAQLNADLTDIVPGSERIIIPKSAGMGEGHHFYKIGGKYFITSAEYAGFRMPAARADSPLGPWEVNRAISVGEDFGLAKGYSLAGGSREPPFTIRPPQPTLRNTMSMHQGGIVQTPAGEWWGWSMFEGNSVGRLTALSPVTWKDGWPYFGLPGNLTRTPRTWVKPKTASASPPHAPYERNDDFSEPRLKPIWQWNHVPADGAWSLSQRPGYLRLNALPAADLLAARDTLTQRAIGPRSTPTVILDASGLARGDVAGLALLGRPYAWIGVERTAAGLAVVRHDEEGGDARVPLDAQRIWLRATCDFLNEQAVLSFSTDGRHFRPIGGPFTTVYQLITFQGVRYGLFAFNRAGVKGGHADFDAITLDEPHPYGQRPIPLGQTVGLAPAFGAAPTAGALRAPLHVEDRGLGRVALLRDGAALTVSPDGAVDFAPVSRGPGQSFQWMETLTGEIILMSLATDRYLRIDAAGLLTADSPGPAPDGKDGTRFRLTTPSP